MAEKQKADVPGADTWLLVLGAGASMGPPAELPAFVPVRDAILRALGWFRVPGGYERPAPLGGQMWPPLTSHRLLDRDAPAEVVFGALARFGVPFAQQLADVLSSADRYNAVHLVAARVLATGGTGCRDHRRWYRVAHQIPWRCQPARHAGLYRFAALRTVS